MLNDFELITHNFPGDITIYPIADVHLGAMEHAESKWKAFVRQVEQENAYLIIAGDMLNNSTRGTKFANPFDEILRPREAKRRMVEYLTPIADRILCYVGGNHESRTAKDSDQDISRDICCKLNIEHLYRENMAFMAVGVGRRNTEKKALATYTFAVAHGSGGGALTGSAVNKSERFGGQVLEGVDCIVTGHVHKGFVSHPSKIVVDPRNKTVTVRTYYVVSCESWLNYGGYAAKAMLTPAEIGVPQQLRLVANKDNKRIIMTW